MNQALAQVMILLMVGLAFLLTVGIFVKQGEFDLAKDYKGWMTFFMVAMFVGVALIFLNAAGWLRGGYEFMVSNGGSTWFMSIIALAVVIGLVFFITKDSNHGKDDD